MPYDVVTFGEAMLRLSPPNCRRFEQAHSFDVQIAGARWFHVTGITPALSPSAAEATREALKAARAGKLQVSIDLNYRIKLWGQQEAGRWMTDFMDYCDVLITTEEDTERVFGITGK